MSVNNHRYYLCRLHARNSATGASFPIDTKGVAEALSHGVQKLALLFIV
jgi:hypothetical protein